MSDFTGRLPKDDNHEVLAAAYAMQTYDGVVGTSALTAECSPLLSLGTAAISLAVPSKAFALVVLGGMGATPPDGPILIGTNETMNGASKATTAYCIPASVEVEIPCGGVTKFYLKSYTGTEILAGFYFKMLV